MMSEVKILTPLGMLGYGLNVPEFWKGVALKPDVITVDSGSTDSGPQKLGAGVMTCSREAYVKDISVLLKACFEHRLPVHISSAGGDGTNAHVDVFFEIVREIAKREGYSFKVALIYADIPRDYIRGKLCEGKIRPLGPVDDLTEKEVDAATNIVAQMGAEPFLKILKERPDIDVIIAGRAYDPVPIAATGIKNGIDPALCWHLGKIMECGAACAEPQGRNILGILKEDCFEVEPIAQGERCTVTSVAAHTLYEKSNPLYLHGPGGMLDLSECTYEQITDRRVRVRGSKFIPSRNYTVKLEGAKKIGFRSIFIGGARDPIFISQWDYVQTKVLEHVRESFPDVGRYELIYHVYGMNGVMAELEPTTQPAHELCIIGEVAAETQELATAICGRMRTGTLHCPYPGKIATAGNLGHPVTPLEIPLGDVCKFNIYHIMEVENGLDLFPIRYEEVR